MNAQKQTNIHINTVIFKALKLPCFLDILEKIMAPKMATNCINKMVMIRLVELNSNSVDPKIAANNIIVLYSNTQQEKGR